MGTWGVGLYDNDTASDLRDAYEHLWKFGIVGQEAASLLLNEFRPSNDDWSFWFALADLQCRSGMLTCEVKERVVSALEQGADSEDWDDVDDRTGRPRVLRGLLQRLNAQPRKPKAAPAKYIENTVFEPGQILLFRTLSGAVTVLRVVQSYESRMGAIFPIVETLSWESSREPTADEIRALPLATVARDSFRLHGATWQEHVGDLRDKGLLPADVTAEEYLESYQSPLFPVRKSSERDSYFKRVRILASRVQSSRRRTLIQRSIVGSEADWTWNRFDEKLARCFGIK